MHRVPSALLSLCAGGNRPEGQALSVTVASDASLWRGSVAGAVVDLALRDVGPSVFLSCLLVLCVQSLLFPWWLLSSLSLSFLLRERGPLWGCYAGAVMQAQRLHSVRPA